MDPDAFLWSGVASGVKKSGNPDLGLAYSAYPSTVAGVFTRNSFPAAPVQIDRDRLSQRRQFRGLVVNSGVANAATGEEGRRDCEAVMDAAAETLGLDPGEMLAASTGHIGDPLPVGTIKKSLPDAVDGLNENTDEFAEAIMTTDSRRKSVVREIPEVNAVMRGVAKGAGMIRPDMATMLAFVFLDHPVDAGWWQESLERACDRSFNEITVDGEMSTNDTVLAFGSGREDLDPIDSNHEAASEVRKALTEICQTLARSIVLDGEGATRLIDVSVSGASTQSNAETVADSIANSNLLKTAVYGGDPNWGRIFSATGATTLDLDADTITISMNGYPLYDPANDVRRVPDELNTELREADEVSIEVNLDRGTARAHRLTCDLTEEYVEINADYEP